MNKVTKVGWLLLLLQLRRLLLVVLALVPVLLVDVVLKPLQHQLAKAWLLAKAQTAVVKIAASLKNLLR